MTSISSTPYPLTRIFHSGQAVTTQHSHSVNGDLTNKVEHFGNVKITSHRTPGVRFNPGDDFPPTRQIDIETGSDNDTIHLKMGRADRVMAEINGVTLPLDSDGSHREGVINIKTNGGNDRVTIDNNILTTVNIDTGAGEDKVQGGGGDTEIRMGDGRDVGKLGTGPGSIYGGNGDDVLHGGSGGSSHLSGDAGSNTIVSGSSNQTWVAAQGDYDYIRARAQTTINTTANFTHIHVEPNIETTININESAGNTQTFMDEASAADDRDEHVTFTGRNDPAKDVKYYL